MPQAAMGQIRQSSPSNKNENKKANAIYHAMKPTFDIPVGNCKTSAKMTSPAVNDMLVNDLK
jgi:hypothetical protein